ncbi:cobalt-zinc-cadmium efflux system protein [Methylomarinovum caldicuralii]|uniref:Cobalt-zinc-cadmium efflux system protein n=1 Tax=Methylomarinovum caldicuralii TaxID=438856 RepID=A0AAU9CM83_9GAMM|nr:cation diffusion facilitator family transporter [Methylomarinovum caldicuralii]BCX80963.1 cobalt-zinc-cadmium efflux system protein [Methylomarinovum caldicuralii]
MAHHHHHHHGDVHETRLIWALLVNVLLTVVQMVGGILSGSLALVADALHNLADAGSLAVALVARWIAKRPADQWRTFGYQRAELIGALINLTTLLLIGLYLIYEALLRFVNPQPIEGWTVVYVGAFALVVDVATALLTYAGSKHSANIRAAFLHNVADALGSVAVIVAGTLVIRYGWHLADPVCTVLIAAYVLRHGWVEMKHTIRILMQSTPADINLAELIHTLESVEGVCGVHHVHVWEIDEHRRSLEAHVVIDPDDASRIEAIKQRLKRRLEERYHIGHSTLEFELATPETVSACLANHEACGQPNHAQDHGHARVPFPWAALGWALALLALTAGLAWRYHLSGDWQTWLSDLKTPRRWSHYEWTAYGLALVAVLAAWWTGRKHTHDAHP